ncbi:unnamed protein product [Calicophoron daubneyi]|uniref:WD repeat and SOCS box-containing protein 1 n=1 Tax=Calicophoron daubneyi TaxID=300641 RepID=A0AAV2THW1_CALDB
MRSSFQQVPLRLAAACETSTRHNISCCGFSKCGRYFAFAESPRILAVYLTEPLLNVCFTTASVSVDSLPDIRRENRNPGTGAFWRILSSELLEGDSVPAQLSPVYRIEATGEIQHMAFAHGDIGNCRLPHRSRKRMSRVVQYSHVSLILLGLATGYTEVYNMADFLMPLSRIPKLVLVAESIPIYFLSVAPDTTLRVASVHSGGEVKLWDLWDDGNMYASLKQNFVFSIDKTAGIRNAYDQIYGEACTFAWQPYGSHICLAGQKGYAVVLQSEKPFSRIATLRSGHFHRISSASYTHDGSMLVTASYDSSCVVWSVPEYAPLHHYWHMGRIPSMLLLGGANGHHIYGMAVAPDDLHFATICEDRCVRLWSVSPSTSPEKTYYEVALDTSSTAKLRSLAFSACGRLLAVTTSNGRVLVFTTPSRWLNLTTLCLRVIRRCVTRHLTEQRYPNLDLDEAFGNLAAICSSKNLFLQAASQLPVPPNCLQSITHRFRA